MAEKYRNQIGYDINDPSEDEVDNGEADEQRIIEAVATDGQLFTEREDTEGTHMVPGASER